MEKSHGDPSVVWTVLWNFFRCSFIVNFRKWYAFILLFFQFAHYRKTCIVFHIRKELSSTLVRLCGWTKTKLFKLFGGSTWKTYVETLKMCCWFFFFFLARSVLNWSSKSRRSFLKPCSLRVEFLSPFLYSRFSCRLKCVKIKTWGCCGHSGLWVPMV